MNIVVIDYGMGNIRSIQSSLLYLGVKSVIVSSDRNDILKADKIILPGVGAFGEAVREIKKRNLEKHLAEAVLKDGKPILGICLGMQLLGLSSEEGGFNKGLNFVNGVVTKLYGEGIKIPHVGFNQIQVNENSRLYNGLNSEPDFYFTHSFKMTSEDDIGASHCVYGSRFVASFENNNVAGVQFHPELSQNNGLRLLKNFIERF
ncbi:imidazole glycerol phosphate synthase subunit HisH [Pedobacter sp. JY14-1]|uniref:imidazole glycerol phosphate synthase subunit HisH n=1 Tax=Pedobacter sp. JY14-1 TaxID=3034151 RepID=UPI0023E0A7BC|nr:imidazole glycerol phosphate synthase subunit HisH [Pedobacter sp. JY14-1]